jgi:NAD(P)-dependent dehydrogenase (short-subunit alcohol dehydrogenase family)
MGDACRGQVALVTGASRGIGKAIALRLAAEGAAVGICSRPDPAAPELGTLGAARDEIAALGGAVAAVPFDLRDPSLDRAELVDRVEAELGPVTILVNNAAGGGFRSFMDWTDRQIEGVLELNLWAPWHLIRRVLPPMRERGAGWILNVSSQTAVLPKGPPFPPTQPSSRGTIYGGTKAFLNRWTASLASETYGEGIAVNTLAPEAAAATEILVEHSNLPEHLYEPLDTMAEAALALCTADPAVVTGQITTSLQLLVDLDRPVFDLRGDELLAGWQPADLPPKIDGMARHARGETSTGPSNVDQVLDGLRRP